MTGKRKKLVETCAGTSTLLHDRQNLELALVAVPNFSDLLSLALPPDFESSLRNRGLPIPRTSWPKREMDKLHDELVENGYDAGVAPIPLIPLPPRFLSPVEAGDQAVAIAELAAKKIGPNTILSASLVRRLRLIPLNGRARLELFRRDAPPTPSGGADGDSDDEDEEAPLPKRPKTGRAGTKGSAGGKGGRGGKKTKKQAQTGAKKGSSGIKSFVIRIYDAALFERDDLVRDVVYTDDLRLGYSCIQKRATLRSAVNDYALARETGSGIAVAVPHRAKMARWIWGALRSRSAAEEYNLLFKSQSVYVESFSFVKEETIRRMLGRDFASAAIIIAYDLRCTDSYLSSLSDHLDAPLTLSSIILLFEIISKTPCSLPIALPPSMSNPSSNLADNVASRSGALADAISSAHQKSLGVNGSPVMEKTIAATSERLKTGYSSEIFGDPMPGSEIFVDLQASWAQLMQVADFLRSEKVSELAFAAEDVGDGPVLEGFLGMNNINKLALPHAPAAASCHDSPQAGGTIGTALLVWENLLIRPLLDFLALGISAASPSSKAEWLPRLTDATLEEVLYLTLVPSAGPKLLSKDRMNDQVKAGWTVPGALSRQISSLARWTYRHRFRLLAVLAVCQHLASEDDHLSVFGDAGCPTFLPSDQSVEDIVEPCIVWQYQPFAELLSRLAQLSVPTILSPPRPAFDYSLAYSLFLGDNEEDAGFEALPISPDEIESFLVREGGKSFHSDVLASRVANKVGELMEARARRKGKRKEAERDVAGESADEPFAGTAAVLCDGASGSAATDGGLRTNGGEDVGVVETAERPLEAPAVSATSGSSTSSPPPGSSPRHPPRTPSPPHSPRHPHRTPSPPHSPVPTSEQQTSVLQSPLDSLSPRMLRDRTNTTASTILAMEPTAQTLGVNTHRCSIDTSTSAHIDTDLGEPPSSSSVILPGSSPTPQPPPQPSAVCTQPSTASSSVRATSLDSSATHPGCSPSPAGGADPSSMSTASSSTEEFDVASALREAKPTTRIVNSILVTTLNLRLGLANLLLNPFLTFILSSRTKDDEVRYGDAGFVEAVAYQTQAKAALVGGFFEELAPREFDLVDCLQHEAPVAIVPPLASSLVHALASGLDDLAYCPEPPPHLDRLRSRLCLISDAATATGAVTTGMQAEWASVVAQAELARGRNMVVSASGVSRGRRHGLKRAVVSVE